MFCFGYASTVNAEPLPLLNRSIFCTNTVGFTFKRHYCQGKSLKQILLSTLVNVTWAVFLGCVPAVNAALGVSYDYKNPLIIPLGYSGLSESRYKRVLQ